MADDVGAVNDLPTWAVIAIVAVFYVALAVVVFYIRLKLPESAWVVSRAVVLVVAAIAGVTIAAIDMFDAFAPIIIALVLIVAGAIVAANRIQQPKGGS